MMKRKKCQKVLLVLLGSLLLSGCGLQEAPYELSEEEQQLVVSYSAHVVSKFNTYQKDGLTHVPDIEEPVLEIEQPEEITETEQTEENTGNQDIPSGTANAVGTEEQAEEATFQTVFGDTGLTFTYLGNEVVSTYMQDETYAVNASAGKNLLVLKFQAENLQTEEPVTIDNLSAKNVFSAKYMMESGEMYHAKSVMTLLLNDFTTYEGTIEPQTSMEMVIVLEIPQETTAVGDIILKVEKDGETFQINL